MLETATNIKSVLHQIYLRHDPSKLHELMFNTETEWMLYHASPSYLTDGSTCIMFEMCSDVKHPLPAVNPYSVVRTSYYNTFKDCLKMFNCSAQTLQRADPSDQYPMPYTPYFHFRERYMQFLKERDQKAYISTKCHRLIIKQWQVVWVNIANTGYIAPLIRVFKYSKVGEAVVVNADVHSILYDEPTIQFVLNYWKKLSIKALPEEAPPVLGYQLNGLASISSPPEVHLPFLNADLHNNILKGVTGNRGQENYIIMSNEPLEGDHFVKQSLTSQVQDIMVDSGLLSYRQKHLNQIYYGNVVGDMLEESSSEEEQDPLKNYHETQDNAVRVSSEEEDESSNDQDNFLRKLYKKALGTKAVAADAGVEEEEVEFIEKGHKGEQREDSEQQSHGLISQQFIKGYENQDSPELSD